MPSKTIICDVDGVVADFSTHLLRAVGSRFTLEDVHCWDIFSLLTTDEAVRARKCLEHRSFWEEQPIIDGAVRGVSDLRSAGYEIVWCTSPRVSCRDWAYVRREWLMRTFSAKNDEVIIAAQKRLVRGACFIDDKPESVRDWAAVNGDYNAWLFDAPYNRSFTWANRLHGWSEVGRVIDRLGERA